MKPSIEPILDADLRNKMLGRSGPWLHKWLMTVTVGDMWEGDEYLNGYGASRL